MIQPAFARRYPKGDSAEHAKLDALVEAFARGDFDRVRRDAPALADATGDDALGAAARDLRRRIDPSPLSYYLLALGVALLAYLFAHYLRVA